MKTISGLAAAIFAAATLVLAPGVAQAQVAPTACERVPYGTFGCEGYLGTVVRPVLAARAVFLPEVSDRALGTAIMDLCFQGHLRGGMYTLNGTPEQRAVTYNIGALRAVKGPFCG